MIKKISSVALILLTLQGCGIYTKFQSPEVEASTVFDNNNSNDTTSIVNIPWKELFTDSHLQSIITEALENNTNLKSAQINIERAQLGLRTARLSYLPSLMLTPQAGVTSVDYAKASQTYNLNIAASWEIDLFGKLHNARKGAKAQVEASKAYEQAVETQLIASVAQLYYNILGLDSQLAISQATLTNWEEYLRAMNAMKEAGLTNTVAIGSIEANVIELRTSIIELKKQIEWAESSMCSLLKRKQQTFERTTLQNAPIHAQIAVGIPLTALRNRPDIQQLEQTLAANHYAVNKARAALYPSLTLSGNAGWTNAVGSMITNPGLLVANAIAGLTQPIFNKGYNRAQLQDAKLQYEQTALQFEQKLIEAGNEVNNALIGCQYATEKLRNRNTQITLLENVVRESRILMENGSSTTYLDVLTAQNSLLQAQLSKTSEQVNYANSVITLYHTLGGGTQ